MVSSSVALPSNGKKEDVRANATMVGDPKDSAHSEYSVCWSRCFKLCAPSSASARVG